jgi:hypothetical protein
MIPRCHACIDINKCDFLGGLSHHLVKEKTNTKKGITKKTCHAITSQGLDANED